MLSSHIALPEIPPAELFHFCFVIGEMFEREMRRGNEHDGIHAKINPADLNALPTTVIILKP